MSPLSRWRLLPITIAAMGLLAAVKLERLAGVLLSSAPPAAGAAMAQPRPAGSGPAAPGPAASGASAAGSATPLPPAAAPPGPAPRGELPAPALAAAAEAESALFEALRQRRQELDRRAEDLAQRELLIAAAEQRLQQRIAELAALQARLEAEARAREAREEAGIRQLVRVYEAMRPRDAAAILDELEMPVLLQVIDRMREAKAAPILAAMRPDRARAVTSELSRLRSRPAD
ncbi:MAG: hypothetical protein RMK64_04630 [Rhodovarius sp.]|nr:hypothetical protein [Rhodovarius sp.]MDW8314236.1 hypothetical protein [Rhodovarius sp.]